MNCDDCKMVANCDAVLKKMCGIFNLKTTFENTAQRENMIKHIEMRKTIKPNKNEVLKNRNDIFRDLKNFKKSLEELENVDN